MGYFLSLNGRCLLVIYPDKLKGAAVKRLPQRKSLVSATVEVLREAIASGEWPRWLPGELELVRRLRVSRVTLRAALAELERGRWIRAGQGRRREILRRAKTQTVRPAVVLLTPEPLHRLPASTVFWMDKLREQLEAAGRPLEIHEGTAVYRRRPGHALEELAARLRPAGWVLYRSTPEMQRWFTEHAPGAILAGSRHAGVTLASADVDHGAACRHAAGRFLAMGHRRLAVVWPESKLAGDLESVAGFQEGVSGPVASVTHDGSVRGICACLERLFARAEAPTGLLVFHAAHLLTVLGWLQQKKRRVPEEVSVICRDEEPFLEAVLPSVARYALPVAAFAKRISRLVLEAVEESGGSPREHRLMPIFVTGGSLGPYRFK